jgi:hypothetical protein
MYWFRSSPFDFLPWLALMLAVWLGGWLIAAGAFRLEARERGLAGFGIGLAGFLWGANIFGRWLPVGFAFGLAGVLVLAAGVSVWLNGRGSLGLRASVILILAAAGLGWVFLRISAGVGMFEENVHLPLISTMAAGNMPPVHFANPDVLFAYPYGFHLLGASLVRLGGLFPWSAFDLGKAILWGLALGLAWLAGRRLSAGRYAGLLLAGALVFAGGTRWLLLLAPNGWLGSLDSAASFINNESAFRDGFVPALGGAWLADGGPPVPFPFAFMNGVAEPLIMAHAGLDILNIVLFLLVLLLWGRGRRGAGAVWLALFSLWALVRETSYAAFWAGGVLAWLIGRGMGDRRLENPNHPSPVFALNVETAALILSGGVALIQGGVLTEAARGLLGGGGAGFGLRLPPALLSPHFGALSLFSLDQLALALFEYGPILFFTPVLTRRAWRRFREGEPLFGALALSAGCAFPIPILFTHPSDRGLSRLAGYAIMVWLVLLVALIGEAGRAGRWALWSLGLMCAGGLVLGGVGLTAASQTVLAYRFDTLDARVGAHLWGRLPPGAQVFDAAGARAATLTGLTTRVYAGAYPSGWEVSPEWANLERSPSADALLAAGYPFVYVDEIWWGALPADSRASLSAECVSVTAEFYDTGRTHFRRLLDLRGCPQERPYLTPDP